MITLQIEGLDKLMQRFSKAPEKLNKAITKGMEASLLVLWENVPPYPNKPPSSTYQRTGTLGRTLGVGIGGQKQGTPDIYEVKSRTGHYEASFGTRLHYAPYVIGERQAWMHQGRWWNIITVAQKSVKKIEQVFQAVADELARYLDGK